MAILAYLVSRYLTYPDTTIKAIQLFKLYRAANQNIPRNKIKE